MRAALPAQLKSFVAPVRPQQRGAGAAAPPAARLGGGGGNDSRNQRIIFPGQNPNQDSGTSGGRLIIPGQSGGGSSGGLAGGGGLQQNFRPPPGFMNTEPVEISPEVAGMSTEEMINRLRSYSGSWHQLAKLIPALQRAGIDAKTVEEETGVERKTQNVWQTASQVYESIKAPGVLAPEVLAHFDVEGEDLLYELRFLAIKHRGPAAAYIATNNLSPHESQVLARAFKEHERREGRREGFRDTPGDVMAYKHYRDAMECRRKEDIEACAKKGLAVVESEEARAKLSEFLEERTVPVNQLPTAVLTTLRLARDELGFRPLAVAGELQTATADQVLSAPKVASEGVFGNFKVPAHGLNHTWVALPNWSVVTLAAHPVALTVANCNAVPRIRESSSAKTDSELKRAGGEAVLVVDIAAEDREVRPSQYYLVETSSGVLDMTPGGEVGPEARVLGPVLFLCRPPSRETAAASTSELMSL